MSGMTRTAAPRTWSARWRAALPGYLYSTGERGIYANLYHSSTLDWRLQDGSGLELQQKTEYPWGDSVEFTVNPAKAASFSLFLRIPEWAGASSVAMNGKALNARPRPGQYYEIARTWNRGDKVVLRFDMTPQLIESNPLLRENTGRVAVQRGPLVYCLEQPDQALTSLFEASLKVGPGYGFKPEFRKDLLGGILVLKHAGSYSEKPLSDEPLYQRLGRGQAPAVKPVELTLIPYYAWANRGPAKMEVWIPVAGSRGAQRE